MKETNRPGAGVVEDTTVTMERVPVVPVPQDARARLVVVTGPEVGRKFTIAKTAVLGRSTEADIVLDDSEVSRKHAEISRAGNGPFVLKDLGSRNGTFVNGVPVEQRNLTFGDKIQLGSKTVLLFTLRDPVEEQILQRQRLEALGRLGAGIAHDFNNMVGAVTASLEFLMTLPLERTLGDADVRESLADIQSASRRAAELTPRLLSFARGGSRQDAPVDMSQLCQDAVQLVQRTFDRKIRVVPRIETNLTVLGDRVELHQVLMNLFLNARDAMPQGGELTVDARIARPEDVAGRSLRSSSPHVLVLVRDTGMGMDAETAARIFEPFFTTKTAGAGFGLGLATVHEVVRSHGGHVDTESELQKGSAFRVFLPSAATQKKTAVPTIEGPMLGGVQAQKRTGLIMVVDDEEVVRRSTARLLRQAGHDIVEAREGREAVDMYMRLEKRPDLVLLDLDMPTMAGDEAQRVLRTIDRTVRIVFITGHGDEVRERAARAEGALAFIRKPYDARELLDAVASALHDVATPVS